MSNENVVKLYSYTKVWKVEKKLYSIQNWKLPIAINPYDLASFSVVFAVIFILGKFIDLTGIPTIIRFVLIPYGIANYLMKKKLDGKNPIKYLGGCTTHLLLEKNYFMEKYKMKPYREERMKLNWDCSVGIEQ